MLNFHVPEASLNCRLLFACALLGATVVSAASAAPADLELSVRPTTLRWGTPASISGKIASGKADELVTIQAKDCAIGSGFRDVAEARTNDSGDWTTRYSSQIGTTVRAVYKGEVSSTVTIKQQPYISLRTRPGGRFEIYMNGRISFWRKKVLFQRLDPRVGTWRTLKTVTLTETGAPQGVSFVYTFEKFAARVPKGSRLRAVLTAKQAGPCYLPVTSPTIRK
jgi:hypothetical protein